MGFAGFQAFARIVFHHTGRVRVRQGTGAMPVRMNFFLNFASAKQAREQYRMSTKGLDIALEVKAGTAFREVLSPQLESISERWKGLVHGTYSFDTIGFLRTKADPFANPVGQRTNAAASALLDLLFNERPDEDQIRKAIEEVMQVRSIQAFSPEAAAGIFFAMKDVVRQVIKASGRLDECAPALLAFESRIDAVALIAFGAYARNREKLHLIRVDEIKRSVSQVRRLAERKGAVFTDEGPEA